MGMYTELILGCALKADTPQILIQSLNSVLNKRVSSENKDSENQIIQNLPQKEIDDFVNEWNLINLFYSDSYYIGSPTNRTFYRDSLNNKYYLSTRSNCTQKDTILKFIKYIKSFVEQGTGPNNIFAIVQYEEDEFPTLYGLTGEFHYLDPNIEKNFVERYEKQINTFLDLYEEILPNYELSPEDIQAKGFDPNTVKTDELYALAIQDLIKEVKRLKRFEKSII